MSEPIYTFRPSRNKSGYDISQIGSYELRGHFAKRYEAEQEVGRLNSAQRDSKYVIEPNKILKRLTKKPIHRKRTNSADIVKTANASNYIEKGKKTEFYMLRAELLGVGLSTLLNRLTEVKQCQRQELTQH